MAAGIIPHAALALSGDAATPVPALLLANVLPSSLLKQLQVDSGKLAECPNYWVRREDIESDTCKTVAEQVVVHLFRKVLQHRLRDGWGGAEFWVQEYQGGRGLGFHFDKDEHAMKEHQQMVTPIFSSVLYLTGNAMAAQRQSPTIIVNQRFDHEEGYCAPDNPDHSTLVFPATNNYCLFDGGLGHGVLDSGLNDFRATFLVNWWERKPQAIQPVTEDDVTKFGLTPAEQQVQDGAGASCCSCGCGCCRRGTGAAAEGEGYGEEGAADMATLVPIPLLEVSERDVGVEGCLTLDDLLSERGLRLADKDAVPGVALAHPGLALFPVDQEQLRASQGDLQVGAVLVPLAALGWGSSSDEEGEGECRERVGDAQAQAA